MQLVEDHLCMALTAVLLVSLNMEEEPHAVDILAVGDIPVEELVEDIVDVAHFPLDIVQLLDKTAAGHIESTGDCMVTVEDMLKSI